MSHDPSKLNYSLNNNVSLQHSNGGAKKQMPWKEVELDTTAMTVTFFEPRHSPKKTYSVRDILLRATDGVVFWTIKENQSSYTLEFGDRSDSVRLAELFTKIASLQKQQEAESKPSTIEWRNAQATIEQFKKKGHNLAPTGTPTFPTKSGKPVPSFQSSASTAGVKYPQPIRNLPDHMYPNLSNKNKTQTHITDFVGPRRYGSLTNPYSSNSSAPSSISSSLNYTTSSSSHTTSFNPKDPHGIVNVGNSCYINATLQALLSLPSFIADLGSDKLLFYFFHGSVFSNILHFTDQIQAKDRTSPMKPDRVKHAVARKSKDFRNNDQQDAHEFLSATLNHIEAELMSGLNEQRKAQQLEALKCTASASSIPNSRPKGKPSRTANGSYNRKEYGPDVNDGIPYEDRITMRCPSKRNFVGVILRENKCSTCDSVTSNLEIFKDISVDIFQSKRDIEKEVKARHRQSNPPDTLSTSDPISEASTGSLPSSLDQMNGELESSIEMEIPPSISDLVQAYFSPEVLELDCERCDGKRALQTKSIIQLPRILIIHLKRFRFSNYGIYCKIQSKVKLEEELNLQSLCHRKIRGPIAFDIPREEVKKRSSDRLRDNKEMDEVCINEWKDKWKQKLAKRKASIPEITPKPAPKIEDDTLDFDYTTLGEDANMWLQARMYLNRQISINTEIQQTPLPMPTKPILSLGPSSRSSDDIPNVDDAMDLDSDDGILNADSDSVDLNDCYTSDEDQDVPKDSKNEYERDEIAPIQTEEDQTKDLKANCKYHLQAIVHHLGSTAGSGHYVADVKCEEKSSTLTDWKRWDDQNSTLKTLSSVLDGGDSTAYMLFYVHDDIRRT